MLIYMHLCVYVVNAFSEALFFYVLVTNNVVIGWWINVTLWIDLLGFRRDCEGLIHGWEDVCIKPH